jgi:hypothetical protein
MRSFATLAVLAACSSHYIPHSRGRVAVVIQGGMPAYVRDGNLHPHGFFGRGLQEAVVGNPEAEAAATEFHDRVRDGFIAVIVGAVCMPVSFGYLAANALNDHPSNQAAQIGTAAAIGCTALLMGGAIYTATAEPYRWDAINLFNDAEATPPMPSRPPGFAQTPQPRESMRMRE